MIVKRQEKVLDFGDDHIVVYAVLFLVCALISALGGGWLGVLCFVPAAIALELIQRFGVWRVLAGGR
ncbi:MAG: O-antigen ligase [Halieaceae bacterium]|jgi:O-antigen ligase